MRFLFLGIVFLLLNALLGFSYLSSTAIALWIWYVLELFENSNNQIAFKEYIMVIYGLNYLFSPALSYLTNQHNSYRMKLPEEDYFMLAIPCMILLQLGMNAFKTTIFHFRFKTVQFQTVLNQQMLLQWVYTGLFLRILYPFMPDEAAFFVYLLSCIRFVAVYGLYVQDKKKFKWHIYGMLFVELVFALQQGMFHDFMIWIIFFGLFWVYLEKPSRNMKLVLGAGALLAVYIIQISKEEYRSDIGSKDQEAGLSTFQDAVSKNLNDQDGLFDDHRTTSSLTRINQAWIFASTVNRMNYVQDYQGMNLISKYAEAAFLPRFLAPNKLRAGDREIFNRYSGHRVGSQTSMGLGLLADGYIAYGQVGAFVFAFVLGLILSLIFKLVEQWSGTSPFFILLMFPILHYAVRPDCETQTIMGHIVKGVFVYWCLRWYYSVYFTRKISDVFRQEATLSMWKSKVLRQETKKA